MSIDADMPKKYVPADHESRIWDRWTDARAFDADPQRVLSGEAEPYCILIPPPNVTAALHLGHALNNTLQDILVRAHRMKGYETLWMPGTDHAGIATQTVVEKRVLAEEGKRRTEFERDDFIEKIQAFKDEYEETITNQLQAMGCSCDWRRQRFTMDDICARAVREAFFRLFRDGLIERGKRLVNWDPVTQTALADDEVENVEVEGRFYYLRYPVVDDAGAETGEHVTVATTRPETYLGDTAVAVNPDDPERARFIGKNVRLPFVGRVIPVIGDDYVVKPDPESDDAKAKYASGFLKVTPAHDPNDWEIGQRHGLDVINVMAPDASISDRHGWEDVGDASRFIGLSREDARKAVEKAFDDAGLLAEKKPYSHSVGHSYRSHAPIEPYLSDQWYVKVTDPRLRGFAQRALVGDQRTSDTFKPRSTAQGDGSMRFYPSRYAKTYESWHDNLRDWCISRQLWWGHRIPVWTKTLDSGLPEEYGADPTSSFSWVFTCLGLDHAIEGIPGVAIQVTDLLSGTILDAAEMEVLNASEAQFEGDRYLVSLCITNDDYVKYFEEKGFSQDPDVLDTWFSSALWPLNTMGWPEPGDETAGLLDAFNPTSVLCTAREIITLWVSRMVMFNRYFLGSESEPGQLPFHDVFIHAMIQDGEGRKMSKSLGNGVDPLDIIHTHGSDAMRYTLCHMTTQTQDVRMPVEPDPETGRNTSPKFDLGRNFCTKLWNAARFTLMMLSESEGGGSSGSVSPTSLLDRWMLSRLARSVRTIDESLANYEFSVYAQTLYDLLWRDFCDWYLEGVKPTVKQDPAQQAVLRNTLDAILRLLHPVAPFVTESIFERVRETETASISGLALSDPRKDVLCTAGWPIADDALIDEAAESAFERARELVAAIREVRAQHRIPPKRRVTLHMSTDLDDDTASLVRTLAGVETITRDEPDGTSVAFTAIGGEHRLSDLSDAVDASAERERLERQLADLDKSVKALEGRLGNPGYTEKAPAHLVEQTRGELSKKQSERDAVAAQLEQLA